MSFTRLVSKDPDLARFQSYLRDSLQPVFDSAIINGRLIEGIELDTAGLLINHKLGRPAIGWIIVGKNANADVWEVTADSTATGIFLDATAAVTISLWVF